MPHPAIRGEDEEPDHVRLDWRGLLITSFADLHPRNR